jgi:hypothetical protein
MRLSDLMLATDSRLGADAMEELATILNGRLMQHGQILSMKGADKVPPEKTQKYCPRGNAQSDTDVIKSERQGCVIDFGRPQCENCGIEPAKGRLIAHPVNDNEIGRWLCKGCFISAWLPMCQSADDGRLQGQPQWMSLTHSGALINSTPPRTQRYSQVR